jgi:hypothetical protein
MKITSEIFDKLRSELYFEKYDHLLLPDTPNQEQLDSIQRGLTQINQESLINDHSIFAFAIPERDVHLNSTFNVMFSVDKPDNFIETSARLTFVSINKMKISNSLYKGYSGICLFEFEDNKPKILEKLKIYGEKRSNPEHEMLYLSQKSILDRIFELMNEVKPF